MSDVTIPSYRVAREDRGAAPAARVLLIAGGLLGAVAVGGAVVWGIGRMGGVGGLGGPRGVPVLEPDSRPIKVRPENPGGLVVPNTDQLVLEPLAVRRAAERQQGANATLAPQPEAPQLDLLRREAAPPVPIPGVEGMTDSPGAGPGAPAAPSSLGNRMAALPAPLPVATNTPPATASAPAGQPAPQPPAAQPTTPAPTGRVQVQLGALASEEAARAEWARLQRRVPALAGRQPQVIRLDRGAEQAPLWRLRTSGLPDAPAAQALCDAVRGVGGACAVVSGTATPARGG